MFLVMRQDTAMGIASSHEAARQMVLRDLRATMVERAGTLRANSMFTEPESEGLYVRAVAGDVGRAFQAVLAHITCGMTNIACQLNLQPQPQPQPADIASASAEPNAAASGSFGFMLVQRRCAPPRAGWLWSAADPLQYADAAICVYLAIEIGDCSMPLSTQSPPPPRPPREPKLLADAGRPYMAELTEVLRARSMPEMQSPDSCGVCC